MTTEQVKDAVARMPGDWLLVRANVPGGSLPRQTPRWVAERQQVTKDALTGETVTVRQFESAVLAADLLKRIAVRNRSLGIFEGSL